MGYGVHRRIHKKVCLGSDERPIVILAIDDEEKLRAILPTIVPMVKEGMINLIDTEITSTGTCRPIIERQQPQTTPKSS